jgi:ribonuclease HIII
MGGPSSVTVSLDRAGADALRDALEERGWTLAAPPAHAVLAADGPGAKVVLYRSGKAVFQGKRAAEAAADLCGASAHPSAPSETVAVPAVGSDETGKGDFLGPLVVAAVLVRPGQEEVLRTLGVRDSKTMSDPEAVEVAESVRAGWPHAVVSIGPERYNEMHATMGANLNRVLAWAHGRAIETVLERPDAAGAAVAVVDRFQTGNLVRLALGPKGRALRLAERPRAESHPAVAAASVVARAAFLDGLARLGTSAGVKLAKGSGPPADAAARRVLAKGGPDLLRRVAKMHFRNAALIGARPGP